jgi:hypothetical protein
MFDVNAVGLADGVGAFEVVGLAAATVATAEATGVVATEAVGAAVEPPPHAAMTSATTRYGAGRTIRCMSPSTRAMNEA